MSGYYSPYASGFTAAQMAAAAAAAAAQQSSQVRRLPDDHDGLMPIPTLKSQGHSQRLIKKNQ